MPRPIFAAQGRPAVDGTVKGAASGDDAALFEFVILIRLFPERLCVNFVGDHHGWGVGLHPSATAGGRSQGPSCRRAFVAAQELS